ncbi:hypothetical protein ACJX0J_027309, partial [Zea mays]
MPAILLRTWRWWRHAADHHKEENDNIHQLSNIFFFFLVHAGVLFLQLEQILDLLFYLAHDCQEFYKFFSTIAKSFSFPSSRTKISSDSLDHNLTFTSLGQP